MYSGFDADFTAPGLPFWSAINTRICTATGLGKEFCPAAASNGWLVRQPNLNNQYTESYSENFNVRANLEPIRDFKIELTANRNITKNYQSFFRYDEDAPGLRERVGKRDGEFYSHGHELAYRICRGRQHVHEFGLGELLAGRRAISTRQNELNYNDELNAIGYAQVWSNQPKCCGAVFMAAYLASCGRCSARRFSSSGSTKLASQLRRSVQKSDTQEDVQAVQLEPFIPQHDVHGLHHESRF